MEDDSRNNGRRHKMAASGNAVDGQKGEGALLCCASASQYASPGVSHGDSGSAKRRSCLRDDFTPMHERMSDD